MSRFGSLRCPPFRLRYSLRALAVFVTLFCIWGGYHANRGRRERTAVAILARYDAEIMPPPEYQGRRFVHRARNYYRSLVRTLWGEQFVSSVGVSSRLEPDIVEAISNLPGLDSLTIRAARPEACEQLVPPTGALGRILSARQLRAITIDHWRISAEDVDALAAQKRLHTLRLDSVALPDDGLAAVASLRSLRQLSLKNCKMSDSGLARAPVLQTLQSIECLETPVGTEFASYVSRLPAIATLSLSGRTIDDDFIARLGAAPTLTGLSIKNAPITSASVKHLNSMAALRTLSLPDHLQGDSSVIDLLEENHALTLSY